MSIKKKERKNNIFARDTIFRNIIQGLDHEYEKLSISLNIGFGCISIGNEGGDNSRELNSREFPSYW